MYKKQHTLQARKREAERVRNKYPERVPIICERAASSSVPEKKTSILRPWI